MSRVKIIASGDVYDFESRLNVLTDELGDKLVDLVTQMGESYYLAVLWYEESSDEPCCDDECDDMCDDECEECDEEANDYDRGYMDGVMSVFSNHESLSDMNA